MMQSLSPDEAKLCNSLLTHPVNSSYRYTSAANCELRRILFRSLAKNREDYLSFFFPNGTPTDRSEPWSLKEAQGAIEGAEYTAAARGTACGHIFKNGESTYHCKTCAADDTCVLCAKCFDSSDHEGHMVLISVSPGNSGCCDCGDHEAWKKDVKCSIHSAGPGEEAQTGKSAAKDKQKAPVGSLGSQLPPDLVESIRMTIARSVDYLCDVFSCSPEQLRLPKSEASIVTDEQTSRLGAMYGEEPVEDHPEYALILWNDEKHTVDDVKNQVARACGKSKTFGLSKAMEVNDIGRSVVHYSRDRNELLRMAGVVEQLKLTVTIRSARDVFREQMCSTIIDWISDIAGCAVGNEPYLLRTIVCEELLKPWRMGSQASNQDIGIHGIDDHEIEDNDEIRKRNRTMVNRLRPINAPVVQVLVQDIEDNNDDDDENDDDDDYDMDDGDDGMDIEVEDLRAAVTIDAADMDIDILDDVDDADATGFAPPPPPPPPREQRQRILTPQESDGEEPEQPRPSTNAPFDNVPKTPKVRGPKRLRPSKHWLEKPEGFKGPRPAEPCEDLWQRVRLDFLILYDLRLWKTLRISLRHLYITTVVTIPHFKRKLGLRFAGLYTALAQLYLIADREPDHSIINLSVQMLTTPTITQEVVERGNFLTNLMAILYTFLTTRQVGFPEDVNPKATLAFDAGAVTNRRMFHFFLDLRWLFQSELIHFRMRFEPRYLLQFLDLVKLHQGVCPNVRAIGEHVEYESDTWISASMIVKEINKLCKQVAVSFEPDPKFDDHNANLHRAIRVVGQVTMINAFGYERKRFQAAEIRDDLAWHMVGPFEFEGRTYSVPRHEVQKEPMSFHHPLHYVLSWLLENAKSMSRDEMRALLHFSPDDFKDPFNATRAAPAPSNLTSDELLSGIFDHPLRVCVWLAQMKAGMWVRNGITLRHQAHTYRSVSHRDVGYQRDILMIQAALVVCGSDNEQPGERYLAQVIDRFQIDQWVKGNYDLVPGFEEPQQMDVFEEFFHLLVIVLSERSNLSPGLNEREQQDRVLQHDIAHALCFKPLSFSELATRVTEKVGESDDFQRVLEHMTNYRAPEGLSDTGTFELKPEYIELVDPYYAHYSRNYREEAEQTYKKHMARKTGKKAEDVVYEPHLEPIESGLFSNLAAFTATPLFAQVIGAALNFAIDVKHAAPKVQVPRVETFLHMVLHLTLLAVLEDKTGESADHGFVYLATTKSCNFQTVTPWSTQTTVVSLLLAVSGMDEYASVHPAIKHVLRKMQLRQPDKLIAAGPLGAILDRSDTGSPASLSAEDKERKKAEAKARQAKVMAQMKQQQNSFLQNQGLSAFDDDDFEDLGDDMSITDGSENVRKTWNFPKGTCILCQEETDDQRLYGTFAFMGESNILRQTPIDDPDYIQEVIDTPNSLDRAADDIRPFGVSGKNKVEVQRVGPDGKVVTVERQGLSKGFPHQREGVKGPVATSCGHMMHYNCFELYLTATQRRHAQQIARNHPERIEYKEFICPLCKALGNTFLPIIWKGKECAQEHELHASRNFNDWLADVGNNYQPDLTFMQDIVAPAAVHRYQQVQEFYSNRAMAHMAQMFAPSLMQNMQDLNLESPTSPQQPHRYPLRGTATLSRLFGLRGPSGTPTSAPTGIDQTPFEARSYDLFNAYHRIEESIKVNQLCGTSTDLAVATPVVAMSRSLGLTISSFEIQHRGTGPSDPFATSLVKDLSEQQLTHLRILSETIESYLAINILRSGSNVVARETIRKRDLITAQLFGVDSDPAMMKLKEITGKLLFQDDIFLFFADWLSFMAPNVAEASSILQLCFWAEVVKTIFIFRSIVQSKILPPQAYGDLNNAFAKAVHAMNDDIALPLDEAQIALLRMIVDKYALAFLRKSAVLVLIRYGLDFECPYNIDTESPELERLTKLLHIPSLDDVCEIFTSNVAGSTNLRSITQRWLSQASLVRQQEQDAFSASSITLSHPAIFELVGLPKNYDTLTEEAIKRRCPTTGKEVTDPVVCLLCGDIFCSQAVCCMKDRSKGGCYQHMVTHGLKVGIFINIRKCMVLFLHGPGGQGSFAHAPYLDRHGEPDPTLRRHHQLFLNQKRYERLLREVWLGHGIPTVISRKLEGDINPVFGLVETMSNRATTSARRPAGAGQQTDFVPALVRMALMAGLFYVGRYLYRTYIAQ
ncbi:E3 ubiquitin-protein ligase ubr11 [Pseudocercospora fuligena]|uniref:E3 ubiquitin-protein ligase n=1 Tax=Pseudocercospora fuligena TaxID=685502 RepID=A0A8H6RGS0_9PEZI|nr:E3 ubiquitin-protein ligase ubr11 [Pseudocercospora fuligena]